MQTFGAGELDKITEGKHMKEHKSLPERLKWLILSAD